MKFTDGSWMLQKGVRAHYPSHSSEVEKAESYARFLLPCHPIRHRGDTLSGPTLTATFSSPMPDVIRVHLVHFMGAAEHGPNFELHETASPFEITETADTVTCRAGRISCVAPKNDPWLVQFRGDEKPLTSSPLKGMGYVKMPDERAFMHGQLSLGVGENVYGLGERFTAFVKNGQVVETWNEDPGTGTEQAYKGIPFYLTNRGYGVFVNSPGKVSFEVASEKVSAVQFSLPGESLEYFVIYGPTPKEILEKYTALTGRPALPPAWTFGLWLSTSFTTNYDEATVTEFIKGMEERDLPTHVFHFDCFWMRQFRWCDFEWDPAVFPDPKGMLQRLKERGLRICVWINPYIAQQSSLFKEGAEKGYFLKRVDGSVWQWDLWQPGMAIVDFTNPAARDWFGGKLRALADMGVDAFKTDFGERIPTDVVYHDGSNPVDMHNFYPYIYNKTVFDVLREKRGEGEAAVFARSATVGCQQFPVHWGGDCWSSFESMAESLRGGLSLGLAGFGFWSHDIGGFEGTPPAEIYKRWVAFGLLSSHSRLHGSSTYRVPWIYDDEACDVLRKFTKLKCTLMPYIFARAIESRETGVPVMRAMMLEFPGDPACDGLDRQYMLGDRLLVAPVFNAEGLVTYYVPDGQWTSMLDGKVVQGGKWVTETHDMLSLPLLVRPDSLIPIGSQDSRPDYDFSEAVCLELFALSDGGTAEAQIATVSGEISATAVATRSGRQVHLQLEGNARGWTLLMVGVNNVSNVSGASASATPRGTLLTPLDGSSQIDFEID